MHQNHITVLQKEAIDYLHIVENGTYIDATFGNGGHTVEMLKRCEKINIFCVDRDEIVKNRFEEVKSEFKNANLTFICDKFSNIGNILKNNVVNGIVFDFGVSSMQIDSAERGFSFQKDGKLSMQMGHCEISAYDFINFESEVVVANVLYKYGNEKKSRSIAKKIVEARLKKPIETTMELAKIVHNAVGRYNDKIDPATRTFQAIRIYVNKELEEIEMALDAIAKTPYNDLKASCISFHSLEDSIVKDFVRLNSSEHEDGFDANYGTIAVKKRHYDNFTIKPLHKGVVFPSEEEVRANVRSRSARMRSFEFIL